MDITIRCHFSRIILFSLSTGMFYFGKQTWETHKPPIMATTLHVIYINKKSDISTPLSPLCTKAIAIPTKYDAVPITIGEKISPLETKIDINKAKKTTINSNNKFIFYISYILYPYERLKLLNQVLTS